jgi:two-component system, NtrC family, sensor kinase
VNRAVEAALEANRMTAAERGVKLEPLTGPVLAVRADAGQLQRIISNLVRNSVEAAPPNGWVRVSVESSADRVTIAVEDSGPGPTAEDVPHLFDPFFSGREAGRGRGLGLSVAWQLARQNGGSVSFNPTADGTTRFTLSLPSAPALDVSSPASEERRSA